MVCGGVGSVWPNEVEVTTVLILNTPTLVLVASYGLCYCRGWTVFPSTPRFLRQKIQIRVGLDQSP